MAKAKKKAPTKPTKATNTIAAWEQDPGSGSQPDGGQLIHVNEPDLSSTSLPLKITNPATAPAAKIYSPGTAEFRYWAAADALYRGSSFWSTHLPGVQWEVGKTLPVDLEHGIDFNAYYDRVGLRFFHDTTAGRTVHSGESPDILCHEQGHAILDSIKPELWDAAILEVAAFHESFGDMSAILVGLQLQSLRNAVITETGGVLYKSSRLSRLAEQLGWAIRQVEPSAVENDCLRNAVNSFFYKDPHTLPSSAPANALCSEPHSFSRVFTASFFEALGGMFKMQATQDEQSLQKTSLDMTEILLAGVKAAPVVTAFYSHVAIAMVNYATSKFTTISYAQALRSAFVHHGVLSASTPVSTATVKTFAGLSVTAAAQKKKLATRNIDISEYGLGVDTVKVNTSDTQNVITGAAMAIGVVTQPAAEDAAKIFIEHLVRRGKVKVVGDMKKQNLAMQITHANSPDEHETNTHEIRLENGVYALKRVRIDCGLHH